MHTAPGEEISINASGRSLYFRSGEHVAVKYQGYTGSILKARFISATGSEEGVFNGTDTWYPYWILLFGLLIFWVGFKKDYRDPEGSE